MLRLIVLSLVTLAFVPHAEKQKPWESNRRTQEYPWMSTKQWNSFHESFLKRTKEGKVDILFLGDSITQGWGNNPTWQRYYAPRNAANFGIGGDTTQNVLWRIKNGELDGIHPKVLVLLIGTNNFGNENDNAADVAKGVTTIVETIRKGLPDTKIILLGIFPRDERPGTDFRKRIHAANDSISKLDDGKAVRYLDLESKFLSADGSLSADIAPDFLHISDKGYAIWAEAMEPLLNELLGH
jgi:lysophospholipase L1-like esterase